MFQVSFHVYQMNSGSRQVVRANGVVTLPKNLAKHVDLVTGLSEFFKTHFRNPSSKKVVDPQANVLHAVATSLGATTDPLITPSLLRQHYNVSINAGTNSNSYQGIAAFDDYFSSGALQLFWSNQSVTSTTVSVQGSDCLSQSCDQYESDLDTQYMTALGQNINTLFLVEANGYWVLQFTDDALTLGTIPNVFSISYGWSELDQCAIATINCPVIIFPFQKKNNNFDFFFFFKKSLGYSSITYITRTNTNFQKLGTMGVSVMVSSGDDGAPLYYEASGACPYDSNHYCPIGGCAHTSSQCVSFTVTNQTGSKCFFPMGYYGDACSYMKADNVTFQKFIILKLISFLIRISLPLQIVF